MTDWDFNFPCTDEPDRVGVLTFRDCDGDILTTETYMKLPTEKVCKAIVIEGLTDGYFNLFLYSDFARENLLLEMLRVDPTKINQKLLQVLEIG